MRDYGKVFTSIWASPTFRQMSEDGRSLVLYLLTCPHGTISGTFRLPDGYLCEDLQWTPQRVAKAFAETLSKGFANRCETSKWVWIEKFLEWNHPENPNQRKAAAKQAVQIPDECAWKPAFMRVCGPLLGVDNWSPPEPLPNPSATLPQPGTGTGTGTVILSSLRSESRRGSRLAADWTLPDDWREWAKGERPDLDPGKTAERFADFWHSKSGKDGSKVDWFATWRNWVRNERSAAKVAQSSSAEPEWRRIQRERNEAVLGPAAQRRTPTTKPDVIEEFHANAIRLG